jgi:hypothetical protein
MARDLEVAVATGPNREAAYRKARKVLEVSARIQHKGFKFVSVITNEVPENQRMKKSEAYSATVQGRFV